jgi:hypothetical protein
MTDRCEHRIQLELQMINIATVGPEEAAHAMVGPFACQQEFCGLDVSTIDGAVTGSDECIIRNPRRDLST